jgi:hypothetical protein
LVAVVAAHEISPLDTPKEKIKPMHPIENLARDLYHAMRQLTRSREFALMAILTLAFGIGANSAIFSIVEAVLLRPLPYRHPEQLVVVWQTDVAHRDSGAYFNTYREFDVWRQQNRSLFRGKQVFLRRYALAIRKCIKERHNACFDPILKIATQNVRND